MSKLAKVYAAIVMPVDELDVFMRLIRTWENKRTDIDIGMRVESDVPSEKAEALFRSLNPEFATVQRFDRCEHCGRVELPHALPVERMAPIMDLAIRIAMHWHTQEGVNGALLDELTRLVVERS